MFHLTRPSESDVRTFVESQQGLDFTYPQVGATTGDSPPGYSTDHARALLGEGEAAFDAARQALERWEQFRLGWVEPGTPETPLEAGETLAVLARLCGLWAIFACRIVYVVDEQGPRTRFGFAYGTLPEHPESGEERFLVEWNRADDSVWYDVQAFFRPRKLIVRLGWPCALRVVNRFRKESAQAMQRATAMRLS